MRRVKEESRTIASGLSVRSGLSYQTNTRCLTLLSALVFSAGLVWLVPSYGQSAAPSQAAPSGALAGQPPAVQQSTPQVVVPIAEFLQYEKFLTDQTREFADKTNQQLEFIKQQTSKNSDQATTITSFLKQETDEFRSFVEQSVGAIFIVASVIAGLMAFFGIRRWKDVIEQQRTLAAKLMEEQRLATESLMTQQRSGIEQMLEQHNATMDKLISEHDAAIERSLTDHSGAVSKLVEESDRNQQKWFKQMSTEMSAERFDDVISKKAILWSDETHAQYNSWLINLIKGSKAKLDAVNKAEATANLNSGKHYDVIVSDSMEIFDEFPKVAARKIINTGEEGLLKYNGIAKQHGVDAVVDTDAKLLRAILSG